MASLQLSNVSDQLSFPMPD